MLYIGFSTQTHRFYARILCRHFRHVAPVLVNKNKCIIYQFIAPNNISLITIKRKDLKILQKYGWKFVKYNGKFAPKHAIKTKPITCVQFTKRACRIKNIAIQTPDALFRYVNHK